LPDGTNVWLNAATTLRYPVQFTGKERRVEISGEAYLEVAHNAAKPFIVQVALPSGDADVTVLGTHFNIMAYKGEDVMKTTLLEGRVSVSRTTDNGQRPMILKPGQEAQVASLARPEHVERSKGGADGITVSDDVDTDQTVAWKNGFLSFQRSGLKSVMRQVERWYDIDVVYEGSLPQRTFSGKVPSSANLSELLQIFEANSIHFNIDGRVLTVKP
jgi:ferric-dicitrate binding protein FerR (iron transport regulator)